MPSAEDRLFTPKFVKDRLIRIETRLVKYQESNVVQQSELTQAVEDLALVMQEMLYKLSEMSDETDDVIDGTIGDDVLDTL